MSIAIAAALLVAPLVGGARYFGRDLSRVDLGNACEIKRALETHAGLLVARDLGNGVPLLADPQAQLFYPLRWLLLLFSPSLGVSLAVVLHLSLAAGATTWLARSFGLRPTGAALTGLAFAFAGPTLDLIDHAAYMVGAVVLPLAWAATRRLLASSRSPVVPALLTAALAGGLLGGEPQSVAIALVVVALEVAAAWRRLGRPPGGLRTLVLAAAGGLLIGLAAWWGIAGELALAPGAHGVSSNPELGGWGFRPLLWLGALLPGALSTAFMPDHTLWGSLHPDKAAWCFNPYWGALMVAGAALGWRRRRMRVVGLVTALALVMSLGDLLPPVVALVRHLPVFGWFRYAAKYLPAATLGLALLAGAAFDRRLSSGPARRSLVQVLAVGAALCGAGAVLAGWPAFVSRWFPELDPSQVSALAVLLRRLALTAMAPVAIAALLTWRLPAVIDGRLGILVLFDLLIAAMTSVVVGPPLDGVRSPLAELTSSGDRPVICSDTGLGSRVRARGDETGWSEMKFQRLMGSPNLAACDGVDNAVAYSVAQTSANRWLARASSEGSVQAARALGCSYSVVDRLPQGPGWERVRLPAFERLIPLERGGTGLVRIIDPVPEAFAVVHPVLSPDESQALGSVMRASSLEETLAVIDDPLHRWVSSAPPSGGGVYRDVSVQWSGSDRATLSVEGRGSAVVGLRTSFNAGWTARQSGQPLPIVRVAGSELGAVVDELSAGPVEFVYELPHRVGRILLVVVGLILAVAGCRSPRRLPDPRAA